MPNLLKLFFVVAITLLVMACRPTPGKPPIPTTEGQIAPGENATPHPPIPVVTPNPHPAADASEPTIADFWEGRARFVVDVPVTGLPMGESDTLPGPTGEFWSYLHASDRSAGVVDQCGDPVDFPGCVVIYRSQDQGISFTLPDPPTCQIACNSCPCQADVDHTIQQQYPRVHRVESNGSVRYWMTYEYQGRVMLRHSDDGLTWSAPEHVADSLIWHLWYANCPAEERIGEHPFTPFDYECLRGGPPGIFVEDDTIYVFMAQGQNPSAMGCFARRIDAEGQEFRPCSHNPLFVGAAEYGPEEARGPDANAFFDFRTISSADLLKIGTGPDARYYMFYEGVRGPGPGDPGDTQFALGLARTQTDQIDGPWEKYRGNPILVDLPGNIGLGHADPVVIDGRTYLYTSLDGTTRSRLVLVWQ